MKRLNVLINAYAVCPNKGSEPGMGWNWIMQLSEFCNVFVITEGEFKDQINDETLRLKSKNRVKFSYIDVEPRVREICWNQGDWRFYFYYHQWQRKAFKLAKQIISLHDIDVVHQLNMVGYREPGLMWRFKDVPTVWGPIGGFGNIKFSYLKLFTFKDAARQIVKSAINSIQFRLPYISKAIKHSDRVIACNSDAKVVLEKFRKDQISIIHEAGSTKKKFVQRSNWNDDTLKLLWIGRGIASKALKIALEVMDLLSNYNIELQVIGVEDSGRKQSNVTYCGWMSHEEVQEQFLNSHLLFFTSLFEATGTVVLESISNGIPVLCHKACGQGDIIDDTCGRAIPMININSSIDYFKEEILRIYHNRDHLEKLSKGALDKASSLSWDKNTEKLLSIYQGLLE